MTVSRTIDTRREEGEMTFEAWWKQNEKWLSKHIRLQEWTYIKHDYEAAWHDGWRIGFELAKNKGGGNEHPLHTQ